MVTYSDMTKKITIFGSTGSIGKSTIDIILRSPEKYEVVALTANKNFKLLAEQAIQLNVKYVCITDVRYFNDLKILLSHTKIKIFSGSEGLIEIAKIKSDLAVASIVGSAGLAPCYEAIKNGINIALANKESLVCAGNLMIEAAKKNNVLILPTDSEHNAIFQVFEESNREQIEKIILTASGGPFLNTPLNHLQNISPAEATKHPNWNMGKKITVDCSNMINKGLEIIEAHYLFDMPAEKIDVLIHPQSTIHSMVCYKDGSSLAQLGNPDMRTPISYVLDWPKRPDKKIVETLDLAKIQKLTFFECDHNRFPAVRLCKETIANNGNAKIILNAANEVAVEAFLLDKIKYTNIINIIEKMLQNSSNNAVTSIEEVIAIDQETKIKTEEYISKNAL